MPDQDTAPAAGASRRLQALLWLGYDLEQLEARTGITKPVALSLLWNPPARIPDRLHKAIAGKYRELILVKPAATASSNQARRVARAAHWYGPMSWDDIDGGHRPSVSHSAFDRAAMLGEHTSDDEPEAADDSQVAALKAEVERLTQLAAQLEADLTRILADQRRADQEHASTAAAVDEYAALKLKAEGDCADSRAALVEAGNEIDRLKTANAIYREQIVESEDRSTAAHARALAAERDALQLREDLANEQEAYRKLHASSRQLQQSFDELAAMKTVREDVAVRPAGQPTRVGELVVEQTPDGTRLVYTSRKTARINFGGVEVEIPA